MQKIFVVEDDKNLRNLIRDYLVKEGYQVTTAVDGNDALAQWRHHLADLVILDVMMPGLDGYEVLEYIREESSVPVIFLTAKGELSDRIQGFETGADDYMTKPFSIKELLMRIKAILKRTEEEKPEIWKHGLIEIHPRNMEAFVDGNRVDLTTREYDLLIYLVENAGIPVRRETIIDRIWGLDFDGDDRAVDTAIKRLRKKMGRGEDYIKTIRGIGYKFEVEK
ncbi:response regulator transcription factor [Alkalibacter rhizosphaerae]|uniref:Stage 0 sporulation protein A homolog n=1 Tax=Alkalibacter rhizosphaerae TaxID=2815577 RepID=A0A974XHJ0_9FIRM|nr:response regulator transcription factor [Alkalibacter rhizosphaerae]QSX08478.1 response regulator transcription factor [Alkalibacter rhizosphaerae]